MLMQTLALEDGDIADYAPFVGARLRSPGRPYHVYMRKTEHEDWKPTIIAENLVMAWSCQNYLRMTMPVGTATRLVPV